MIAAALGLFGMIPLLVARRSAMVESREADRYSERLRLLDTDARTPGACERSNTTPILAARRVLPEATGDVMAQSSSTRRAVGVDRRAVQSVREIARLRSHRAARLAAEAAAGRRRLVLSASLAIITALVGIIAATSALTWPWTLIPAGLLLASLGASRLAAIRSQKANAAELDLLEELRGRIAGSQSGARTRPAASAVEDIDEIAVAESLVEAGALAAAPKVEAGTALGDEAGADSAAEAADEAPATGAEPLPAEDADPMGDTASVERRTWTVSAIPAPSYAMRGRVAGRTVHADTDLRGIPKVEAKVPARPLRATAAAGARSTLDVVADQAVALDLDAVLEARRAQ